MEVVSNSALWHSWLRLLGSDTLGWYTYFLKLDRATGSTCLSTYTNLMHCTSVCHCLLIQRRINSLTLLHIVTHCLTDSKKLLSFETFCGTLNIQWAFSLIIYTKYLQGMCPNVIVTSLHALLLHLFICLLRLYMGIMCSMHNDLTSSCEGKNPPSPPKKPSVNFCPATGSLVQRFLSWDGCLRKTSRTKGLASKSGKKFSAKCQWINLVKSFSSLLEPL